MAPASRNRGHSDEQERGLFESGSLMEEILRAAEGEGLVATLEDGQLMCYLVIVGSDSVITTTAQIRAPP